VHCRLTLIAVQLLFMFVTFVCFWKVYLLVAAPYNVAPQNVALSHACRSEL
jgi:hypothetical protein